MKKKVMRPRSEAFLVERGKWKVILYKSLTEVRIHVAIEGKTARKEKEKKVQLVKNNYSKENLK